MSKKEILSEQMIHREWADSIHGIKPTAERLWGKVYKKLLM